MIRSPRADRRPPKVVEFDPHTVVEAHLTTSEGPIVCRLFADRCPITVGNFAALAQGLTRWSDGASPPAARPLYDGTFFHRIIPDFMIQGGDPLGDGTGGPGYRFADEFHPELRHDRAGIVSMANAGPDTNGSQFFITLAATAWLDDRHTVFGVVDTGMEAVRRIGAVSRDSQDRPREPVILDTVKIVTRPATA